MSEPHEVLHCNAISKSYRQGPDQIDVLTDIELTLGAGERLSIVGASGSGKSTLLNLLGGLDQPSTGEVELMGREFSVCNDDQRARLRNRYLGFVYQFHHLLAEFSALENVAMPALIAGMSKNDALQLADTCLQKVGLGERLQHKPSELSGGERQRVAIARALVNEPACVLMDEPTGNLDRDNANGIQQLLMELSRSEATSFVVVTHDEHLAGSMDRVLRLDGGELVVS